MSALTRLAAENPDAAASLRGLAMSCWSDLDGGRVPAYAETLARPDDPTPTYVETHRALGYSPLTLRNERNVADWQRVMAQQALDFDGEVIVNAPPQQGIPARPLSYQARARNSDPATSHEAARSVDPNKGTHARIIKILQVFTGGVGPHASEIGLTDEQIWFWWHDQYDDPISPSGLRSRRNELARRGLVVDSGQRGRTAAGRSCIIWRLP